MAENGASSPGFSGISRRAFFGVATGGLALPLLHGGSAAAAADSGRILTDYVGRLCYNENPLGPSPLAMSAMTDTVPMGHRYPDWYAESLRGVLASIHGVSTGQTIAGCGATEILRLCAHAFSTPGGNVVCPYPSYSQFPADCAFLGSTVRYAGLDGEHRVDLAALAALVDGSTTAVCITNPNNPTATTVAQGDLAAFVAALPAHVSVVIDEAYHEYVGDPSYGSAIGLVQEGRNVVVVRTLSKVYGLAGVRVGYAVGRSTLISGMATWQIYATVSRLAAAGADAALQDAQHIDQTVALNNEAKEYCFMNFVSMGLDYIPSETNFFMVDVGSGSQVAAELAARGILVRTGWGMPAHIRVSTGTMNEMQAFITALGEILGTSSANLGNPPRTTLLDGNFPNPFAGSTRISYLLSRGGPVRLEVFDIRGRRLRTLVDARQTPGRYTMEWDGRISTGMPAASGSYFLRLTEDGLTQTRRMILSR